MMEKFLSMKDAMPLEKSENLLKRNLSGKENSDLSTNPVSDVSRGGKPQISLEKTEHEYKELMGDKLENSKSRDLNESAPDDEAIEMYDEMKEEYNTVIELRVPSEAERQWIKEDSGWSDEIVNNIGSLEEYENYQGAGLKEIEMNGKKYLVKDDIEWDKEWDTGKVDDQGNPIYETNYERIEKGRAPLDKNGNPLELHHIGQHADSPLAELTREEHRCNGNDTILHDKTIQSEAHGEGNHWDNERQEYWHSKSQYIEGGNYNV
ncbi:HNH/ENDO VII family nuclease [Dialister sp.]|uniref:HNH/ENDO VII family nuclease n=1 Tax=Dialister sp. TaxID=1955814 RepID=UPI002E82335C|nr:HNH/ENDO VII family nuclease [Dialister sp.]MEE3452838.1 HNH/ENDO VII family nuclease [Dialister sp.]